MSYTIEITYDQADAIVLQQLRETVDSFEKDLNNPKANIFFFNEPEKDKEKIQQYINAFNLVIDWYAVPE